ncbi:MAG: DUF262 domain-containing protein [Cyanobacteriota bacterium]
MSIKKSKNITQIDKDLAEKQIQNERKTVDYDTKEYTVEVLIQKFKDNQNYDENNNNEDFEGEIYIPDYQRKFVWKEDRQSKFIESVILGLPIPFIFTADMPDGRLEVVDGSQRIQTLKAFINNKLELCKLEKLTLLNGFMFQDLSISQQRKFKNRSMRSIELTDKADEKIRSDVFERINTGSDTLKEMEKRKGIYAGPFYDFIHECTKNAKFNKLCPISDSVRKRGEAEELILRYFAYSEKYLQFKHSVKDFLNDYMSEKNEKGFDKNKMNIFFLGMLDFVDNFFPNGFSKSSNAKSTPRVRFESISIGTTLALRVKPKLIPNDVTIWLNSDKFSEHTTSHASNSITRLRGRIEFVRDKLLSK